MPSPKTARAALILAKTDPTGSVLLHVGSSLRNDMLRAARGTLATRKVNQRCETM